MQLLEIEKVTTVLNDDLGHKVPVSLDSTTTTEDNLPRIGQDTLKYNILAYLYDVKQAFACDIAEKLQKNNGTVRKIISRLRQQGFVRTGLDWRIKITEAGSLYYIYYIDRDRQRQTETKRDTKKKKKETKKPHQVNFKAWVEKRPYLSQEGVVLAKVFIKNYEDNGMKFISGPTFGEFENTLRALWNHYNTGNVFPGEDDLQMRIHEVVSYGLLKTWNLGCFKLYLNNQALQEMQEGEL